MKNRVATLLLIIAGIIFILGCENDITGSSPEGISDSGTASVERGTTERQLSKTVTYTEVEDVSYRLNTSNNPLVSIRNGGWHYHYTDHEGYSGTLSSYDFSIGYAPIVVNGYVVFKNLKIHYRGTVYK